MEPQRGQGKRGAAEAVCLLPTREIAAWVWAALRCAYEEHLVLPKMVA